MVWVSSHRVAALLNLQREVFEFAGREQARCHFAARLTELFDARVTTIGVVQDFRTGGSLHMVEAIHHGFDGERERDHAVGAYNEAWRDPALVALAAAEAGPGGSVTRRRCDLVLDRDWYGSDFVNHARLAIGFDDVIFARRSPCSGSFSLGMGINRTSDARPFTEEDRDLLELVAGDSAWLFRAELAGARAEFARLSRRERQTLDLLLSGRGEKEAAAELGVSPHTLHCYVKRLYRRFDVRSRAELLALFLSRPATDRARA